MQRLAKPLTWDPGEDMTYLVSNSEASNFLACQQKHFYAHILNIEPKNMSLSLSRGNIGHECLALGYEHVRLYGHETWEAARELVTGNVDRYIILQMQGPSHPAKQANIDMLMNLKVLLDRYWTYAENDPWDILAVEQQYTMDLFDQYGYTMRLDLLVQINAGPRKGEIWIVDHKFIYDFYNERVLTSNAQIPKYLATVRAETGLVIKGGILNELRHRMKKGPMTDEELFRREPLMPNATKIRNIMREQIKASEQVIERHNLPVDEAEAMAIRALGTMECKNCSFFDLCMTQLEGNSGKLMIETEFQPNSYGYNSLGEDE